MSKFFKQAFQLTGTGDTLFLLTPGDSDLTALEEDEEELLGEGLRLPF